MPLLDALKPNSAAVKDRGWIYFTVLIAANTFLSFGHFSPGAKAALLAFGILLPCFWAMSRSPAEKSSAPVFFTEEFLPKIHFGWWLGLGLAAAATRLYQLGSFFPGPDEGLVGLYALKLSEKWNWNFFYTVSQHTPVLIWATGLFFRLFKTSFLGLWFVPALISLAILPLAYGALSAFFPKSFRFLCVGLMVFSLWCFSCGRWSSQGILILPWELICLLAAGFFLGETVGPRKKKWAALLGFLAGLGYLTFPSWPFVILLVALTAFGGSFSGPYFKNREYFKFFVGFFILAFLPFLIIAWFQGFGATTRLISALDGGIPLGRRGLVGFSYFSSLFWGTWDGVSVYDTYNLERLSPLEASAFFWGLVQVVRCRAQRWSQWLGLCFLVCLLPAAFSTYVEMFRVIQILPFVLLITAVGCWRLLAALPKDKRLGALALFLAVSAGSDIVRVSRIPVRSPGSGQSFNSNAASEIPRAYGIINEVYDHDGPGLIFTEFLPQWNDPSALVTTYFMNAGENPGLNPRDAKWAAVLANEHYYPFLSARFPGARWYWLSRDLPRGKGMLLGVIPIAAENREIPDRWVSAQHFFRQSTEDLNNVSGPRTYAAARENLLRPPPEVLQDRFLEACYWERVSEFYYQNDCQSHYDDIRSALENAIRLGYPSAHLYYKLGSLVLRKKKFEEAEKAYESALQVEPGYRDASDALEFLKTLESAGGAPK